MFGSRSRAGRVCRRLVAVAALSLVTMGTIGASAHAETRVLKFYNLHTREKATFAYKRNGRYDGGELKKIDWFLRDWRKGKATHMDRELLDLIWEAYRQSGSRDYINVICGYRSPATNNMLRSRSRSSGVAKTSQHTQGRALDFFLPDVPLKKLREIGLRMQVGGVGYYPTSGSPFVHFDVGNARHWPRMSRSQLVAVFPNGGTVHVPSDGKPLPGYKQALASYKQRRQSAGLQVANASSGSSGGGKTLLSFLFGGGADEAEDEADVEATPAPAPASRQPRQAAPQPEIAVAAVLPQSRPTLPGGVAVAAGDSFDTSAPSAGARPDDLPQAVEVAGLDIKRVPLPTSAPARALVEQAQASLVAEIPARSTAVDALIADLEAPATATPSDEAPLAGTLAYAVPTPGDRPAFDDLLKTVKEPAKATADAGRASLQVAALLNREQALANVADAGNLVPTADLERQIATVVPVSRPEWKAPTPTAPAMLTNAAARPASPSRGPTATAATEPASTGGKGGRVRVADAASPKKRSVRIDPQDAIASRIDLATMVDDDVALAVGSETSRPNTHRLVGNLPSTLFTSGFTSSADTGARSDQFSGSAVTFLPLVKIKD